jgi:hypothetical protein
MKQRYRHHPRQRLDHRHLRQGVHRRHRTTHHRRAIVIASVDTYLRFAEAVNRLNLEETGDAKGLPELAGDAVQGAVKHKVGGAIDAVTEWVEEVFSRDKHQDRND